MQALSARLWSSGSCRRSTPGVALRGAGDPVLYLNNPDGVDRDDAPPHARRPRQLNQLQLRALGDPETQTRIAQYEMAFRMQTSVPELTDISEGAESTSSSSTAPTRASRGTFAANCLLARRLVERGVRFVQIYHRGWDQHGNLPHELAVQCKDVDQAMLRR